MNNEKFNHNRIFNCLRQFVCVFTCFILCICLIPSDLSYAASSIVISSLTPVAQNGVTINGNVITANNKSNSFVAYDMSNLLSNGDTLTFSGTVTRSLSRGTSMYFNSSAAKSSFDDSNTVFASGSGQARNDWVNDTITGEDLPSITYDSSKPYLILDVAYFSYTITLNNFAIISGGSVPSYDNPFSLNYELPAGNVIYIKTQNQDDVIALNTTFFTNSKLFSSTWSNITQCYQQNVSDLPSSGVQFPLSGMGTIPWIKSSDTNILGQTKSASFSFQSGSYDTWAVIYNPLYQNFAQPPQGDFNGSIHIYAENCLDYYTYPLSGYLTSYSDNGMVSSSVSDYTDHYTVSRDENGDPIIDSNGNPVEVNQNGDLGDPSFGGTNQTPESTNIIDYVKELGNILSNFTNNFLSLIQVPLSHIGQLIQSGSGFMSSLRNMYAWLPVDIQGLVIAALTVVIGIGVFKVFL